MKKYYHVTVETMEGVKYETLVDSKYTVQDAANQISTAKPEVMVMIGSDLAMHAGDVRVIMIDGQREVEDGTV